MNSPPSLRSSNAIQTEVHSAVIDIFANHSWAASSLLCTKWPVNSPSTSQPSARSLAPGSGQNTRQNTMTDSDGTRRACLPLAVRWARMPGARGRRLALEQELKERFGPYPGDLDRSPYTPSMAGDTVQPLFDAVSFDAARTDQEVVEFPLLLPRWQAMELEAAASRRGMATGQMIRRLLGEMLASQPAAVAGS